MKVYSHTQVYKSQAPGCLGFVLWLVMFVGPQCKASCLAPF